MQHAFRRSLAQTVSTTDQGDTLAAPMVLDDELLALIGGGKAATPVVEMTEPPTPVNAEAGPHTGW